MDFIARGGKTTSEFWSLMAFFAVVLADGTRFVDISGENMAMLAALGFGYGGGRALLKNTAAKGLAKVQHGDGGGP